MASWVHRRVEATIASGGEALWQRVLGVEWGGMNDVLLHLYSISRDPSHLATARRFNAWVFTARLSVGVDDLAGRLRAGRLRAGRLRAGGLRAGGLRAGRLRAGGLRAGSPNPNS